MSNMVVAYVQLGPKLFFYPPLKHLFDSNMLFLLPCRYSDPDSASSSFSILLGDAPHLDGEVLYYTSAKFLEQISMLTDSCITSNKL